MERRREQREAAVRIYEAAVAAVEPAACVARVLHYNQSSDQIQITDQNNPLILELKPSSRVVVIAAGKAAVPMTRAAERILAGRLEGGIVVAPQDVSASFGNKKIILKESSHPLPDERSVAAGQAVHDLALGLNKEDHLLFLLSGGASALLELPAEEITIQDLQTVNRLLLKSGAGIHEINTVRKHLSALKGGQLARLAAPAAVTALILSDCHGNDLSVIGSGPAVPDPGTFAEAMDVLTRRELLEKVPASVRSRLERGTRGEIPETPKPGEACFERARSFIVGDNQTALTAAAKRAEELGYHSVILDQFFSGEAREEAGRFLNSLREIGRREEHTKTAVLAGAECVVTVRGNGKGGRNQEFAAAISGLISGDKSVCVLSAGTDGIDGPTEAAGGLVDGNTLERAGKKGIELEEVLKRNDAYHYLAAAEDLLITGPTGTNVMDIILGLGNL